MLVEIRASKCRPSIHSINTKLHETLTMPNPAYCGNDCNSCPRYMATISGNADRLKEVALLWKKVGWRDTVVSPEEMACRGCKTAPWCRYGIRECALDKAIGHCGECGQFPCEKVLKAFEKTVQYEAICKRICSEEENRVFYRAFFSKRKNLKKADDADDSPIR